MQLGPIGIWSIDLRFAKDRGAIADAAAELEALGYDTLWIPGGRGGKILESSELLLESTSTAKVGTGILNIWFHDAQDVAEGVARIEEAHPGRFLLGIGCSHAPLVDSEENPGRYRKPLTATRNYLDELQSASPPVPADTTAIAALGPKMLELARDRTAGTHPYFVPVEHTAYAREVLGDGPLLAPEHAVALESDPTRAREMAREHMAGYLKLPNYTNNLLRHGFTEDDLRDGGSDRLVDAIVLWGDEESIAERVQAHRDAGADHVCIQIVGHEAGTLPLEEWRRLAPALVPGA